MKYLKIKFPNKRGQKFILMPDFDFDILNNGTAIVSNYKNNVQYYIDNVKIIGLSHSNKKKSESYNTNKIDLSGYMRNEKNTYDYVELEANI